MYCNLTKSQAIPVAIKAYPGCIPGCLNPLKTLKRGAFSHGFGVKPSQNPNWRSSGNGSCGFSARGGFRILKREKGCVGIVSGVSAQSRKFSDLYPSRSGRDGVDGLRRTLPWLDDSVIGESGKQGRVGEVRAGRSSWEEAADKFVRRGGVPLAEEERGRGRGKGKGRAVNLVEEKRKKYVKRGENVNEEEYNGGEDEEVEEVEDPRWYKIKNRLGGAVSEKPAYGKPESRTWTRQENWGRKTVKEATESSVPKMVSEGVYGVGPVLAALSAGRREFYVLYVQEGVDLSSNNRKKKDKKGFERVLKLADKLGLSRKEVSKHDLNMIVDNRPHQGLVLDASPLEMVNIKELDPVSADGDQGLLWMALDEVTDPQNLGAIVRSAYFFGVAGVVLCAKNSAPLSGVVSKASAGSLELMEVRSCKNMMQFLSNSADNGWRVLGGSISSRAAPLHDVSPGPPTIIVLGSEGTGLRPLVERSCTQLVRIPGNFPVDVTAGRVGDAEDMDSDHHISGEDFRSFLAVESLNVSVAAGVFLNHLTGSRSDNVNASGVVDASSAAGASDVVDASSVGVDVIASLVRPFGGVAIEAAWSKCQKFPRWLSLSLPSDASDRELVIGFLLILHFMLLHCSSARNPFLQNLEIYPNTKIVYCFVSGKIESKKLLQVVDGLEPVLVCFDLTMSALDSVDSIVVAASRACLSPLAIFIQIQGCVICLALALGWAFAAYVRNREMKQMKDSMKQGNSFSFLYHDMDKLEHSNQVDLPRVSVVMPLKGFGEHNLHNWRTQITTLYGGPAEFLFVVESTEDPAYHAISMLLKDFQDEVDAKVVIAGYSTTCKKMHKDSKYILFLDDDVRLHPGTIGALTAEMMKNPEIFIQTGYPLDLPSGSLGSYCIYEYHMPCSMGFATGGKTFFLWGGCMMMHADDFRLDRFGVVSELRDGGYSDDMTLAAIAGAHKRLITSPPVAVFPHPLASDLSFGRYWNYLRKQTFVLESYVSNVNWIMNRALFSSHCYLSWGFVMPTTSTTN
ncbi:rRNA methyltransferase 1, mitochondrial-like protein [Drosera capensis]